MQDDNDTSPIKPTIIDLDPDQVTEDGKPAMAEEPKPAQAAARRKGGFSLPLVAAALLIGTLGGGWLYRSQLSAYFPSDEVKGLSERVASVGTTQDALSNQVRNLEKVSGQLSVDIDSLETTASAAGVNAKALADSLEATRGAVATLEAGLAETKKALADIAASPSMPPAAGATVAVVSTDLEQRLVALEKEVADLKAHKTGTVDTGQVTLAFASLKAKISAGQAYAEEQTLLARLLPAAAGLDVLTQHAERGLPNASALAAELAALKPSLPQPAAPSAPNQEQGWWESTLDSLSSVITIRDAGAVDWQAVAEKAQALAEAGNLAQAIVVIGEVEAQTPAVLQQWRDKASQRIALEAALDAASGSVSRVLAQGQ